MAHCPTVDCVPPQAAVGADIKDLGLERGHRTLTILRKGGKVVTVPLAPRTTRAIDLAAGDRCDGPIFVATGGARIDRHAPPQRPYLPISRPAFGTEGSDGQRRPAAGIRCGLSVATSTGARRFADHRGSTL